MTQNINQIKPAIDLQSTEETYRTSMEANTTSNASSAPLFPRLDGNDVLAQESVFQPGKFGDMGKPHMIRWKSGKKVDPRLIMLLQFFRQLYAERQELFKKIFPEAHHAFFDLFKRIGEGLPKMDRLKVKTMQRSLSIGSPRTCQQVEVSEELRLNRFKVRTLVLTGPPPGGGGQTSQTETTTSSNVITK